MNSRSINKPLLPNRFQFMKRINKNFRAKSTRWRRCRKLKRLNSRNALKILKLLSKRASPWPKLHIKARKSRCNKSLTPKSRLLRTNRPRNCTKSKPNPTMRNLSLFSKWAKRRPLTNKRSTKWTINTLNSRNNNTWANKWSDLTNKRDRAFFLNCPPRKLKSSHRRTVSLDKSNN